MAHEEVTPFLLFVVRNMEYLREIGMTPDEVYERANRVWVDLPVEFRLEYFKLETEIKRQKFFNFVRENIL